MDPSPLSCFHGTRARVPPVAYGKWRFVNSRSLNIMLRHGAEFADCRPSPHRPHFVPINHCGFFHACGLKLTSSAV